MKNYVLVILFILSLIMIPVESWAPPSASYTVNTTPIRTDQMTGIDDPAGTWNYQVFPLVNLLEVFLTPYTAEPTEVVGQWYVADNDTWDPNSYAGTNDYIVLCTATGSPGTFVSFMDMVTGDFLIKDASILLAMMAANSVDSDQYVNGSIDTVHLGETTLPPIILAEPDQLQPIDDAWPIFQFLAESYPSGVVITSIHISTSATCTDVLNFEEWSNNGTSWSVDSTVESITLSGTHTEDDGALTDPNIAADGWLYVDLPATPTDIAYYSIVVSFTTN